MKPILVKQYDDELGVVVAYSSVVAGCSSVVVACSSVGLFAVGAHGDDVDSTLVGLRLVERYVLVQQAERQFQGIGHRRIWLGQVQRVEQMHEEHPMWSLDLGTA